MGAAALGLGLLANVYIADDAAAGWRGCGVGAVGSYNAAVYDDYFGAEGPGIAATVSCDVQIDRFVLGAAAEYGWKRFEWMTADVDVKGWAATGRAGVLVTNGALLYALAGWTQVTGELGNNSVDLDGAVAGGGIELDLTHGFFGRLEYQRLMLETDTKNPDTANIDSVRLGLTYKFNPESPFQADKPLK
jgi:opacity protein-like surface antigen